MITFERICELAEALPGTEVGTSYGTPAIKAGGKLVLRMHQKEDAIVMLLGSVEEQQQLIEADPMAFFITDHYRGYAAVLIRPIVDIEGLQRLMEAQWRRVARKLDLAEFESS